MENKTNARFNLDAVDFLIRNQLINMVSYDIHLCQQMDSGLNYAVSYLMQALNSS